MSEGASLMNENMSHIELCARLHFLENHTRYLASELVTEKEKSYEKSVEINELKNEVSRLSELIKLATNKIYGASTEKICEDYDQLSLFGADFEEEILQEKVPVAPHKRAPKRTMAEMYSKLPATEIVYELEDKACPKCGTEMVRIGYDSYREIEYTPEVLTIIEHRKAKYACRECDKNEVLGTVVTASAPLPLIERSFASPSLISHIIYEKFCKYVPLYRLEQEFSEMDFHIPRQTMSNWIIAVSGMLTPLYELMRRELISHNIIHADETPLQVNHVKGKNRPVHGYMWVYRTGIHEKNHIVLYDYRNGRAAEYPKEILKDFSGYIHCDGLKQYDAVPGTQRVGCWAHLRRYFLNAVKVQSDKSDYSTLAGQCFLRIQEIFHVEGRDPKKPSEKSKYTVEEIAEIRAKKSTGLVTAFFEFCLKKQGTTLPNSLTGKAISYALNQKKSLMTFLENPLLELTNNAAERAVKPLVMGRKNWLFANTQAGADAIAVIYSVIQTAKAASLKVYDYFKFLFDALRSCQFNSFADFLPWSDKLPTNLRLES